MMTRKHPARYTPSILDAIDNLTRDELPDGSWILDPFAGTGERLGNLAMWRGWNLAMFEIEPNFAGPVCIVSDSTRIPLRDACMDGAITSVTYAGGLSDKGLRMKNSRGRLTYDLYNGRPLHPNNTGGYGVRQGKVSYQRYLALHCRVFTEVFRVLKNGAPWLVNCSDVVQNGQVRTVTADNVAIAESVGFAVERAIKVQTPRYRMGENAAARVDGEDIVVLRKP